MVLSKTFTMRNTHDGNSCVLSDVESERMRKRLSKVLHDDITIIGDLMWEKESREMNLDEAKEYAEKRRLGGYDGWRLPTREEIGHIVELCGGEFVTKGHDGGEVWNTANGSYQDSYKEKGFVYDYYWTSTIVNDYDGNECCVCFCDGTEKWRSDSNRYGVRCVRDRQ